MARRAARMTTVLAVPLVLIAGSACGHTSSAPPAEAGPSPGPSAGEAGNANANVPCDETSDCGTGACCAERDTSGGASGSIVTKCLPNCITNTPRVKVCKRDAECENGACRAFDCGPGAPALLYCARPDGCT